MFFATTVYFLNKSFILCDVSKKYDLAKPQTKKTWSPQRAFIVSLGSNRVKTICWASQRSFQCSATFLTQNEPSNRNRVLFDGDIFMKCFELSPFLSPCSATTLPKDHCGVTTTLLRKKKEEVSTTASIDN